MNKRNIFFVFFIALIIGGLFSPFASTYPDGLEKIAEDQGFIETAVFLFSGIIPDYVFPGIASEVFATSLAGVIGTVFTYLFLVIFGVVLFGRRGR